MDTYKNIKRILGTEEDQVKLEGDMANEGKDKLIKSNLKAMKRKEEDGTAYGNILISEMTDNLAQAIEVWKEAAEKGAGRRHNALKPLQELDTRTTAYITLRLLISCISNQQPFNRTAIKIGEAICLEIEMGRLSTEEKVLHKGILSRASTKGQYFRRKYTALYMAKENGTPLHLWPDNVSQLVGKVLIELCVTALGIIEVQRIYTKKREEYIIRPTKWCLSWITKTVAKQLNIVSTHQPMVVPPFAWEDPFVGGYLTNQVSPITFVKTRNKAYLERLAALDIPEVYEVVNKVQSTPWQINTEILELILDLQKTDSELGSLPRATDLPEPEKPDDIDTNPEALKNWKMEKSDIIKKNVRNESRQIALCGILTTAQKYAKYEKIYFPYQLDFRGRVYPVTNGSLSPQGPDYVKALLQFANGEKLGTQEAADWLAVHVANVWAVDKIDKEDFKTRIAWTKANSEMLCRVAENPYDYRQWNDADKPFQAVAAAQEWAGYIKNGLEHISRIAVALDGSCSGLQHLGMALRCEYTGKEVNLMPTDKPQDIYQTVINKVMPQLIDIVGPGWEDLNYSGIIKHAENKMEEIYKEHKRRYKIKLPFSEWKEKAKKEHKKEDGSPNKRPRAVPEAEAHEIYHKTLCAFAWLDYGYDRKTGKLSRKLAKNAVMTFPYGSKQFGFTEQLKERVIKKIMDEIRSTNTNHGISAPAYSQIWVEGKYKAQSSGLLAGLLYKAVTATVVKAAEGMQWLQDTAKEVAKGGNILSWRTPLGFLVEQNYWESKEQRIKTSFLGQQEVRFSVLKPTDKIDKTKQASAVAPNFVHSLDATHLMMTVLKTLSINNWALIHDSFGTLPSKTQELHDGVRQTFYALYTQNDVFEDFKEQMSEQVKKKEDREQLPMVPIKGRLDPQEILNSPYSFA